THRCRRLTAIRRTTSIRCGVREKILRKADEPLARLAVVVAVQDFAALAFTLIGACCDRKEAGYDETAHHVRRSVSSGPCPALLMARTLAIWQGLLREHEDYRDRVLSSPRRFSSLASTASEKRERYWAALATENTSET